MQPALWFVGDRTGKPAFVEEDVEVVFPKGLAVPDSEEILDFAGLAGLFAELEDLRRDLFAELEDLRRDLAGDLPVAAWRFRSSAFLDPKNCS